MYFPEFQQANFQSMYWLARRTRLAVRFISLEPEPPKECARHSEKQLRFISLSHDFIKHIYIRFYKTP